MLEMTRSDGHVEVQEHPETIALDFDMVPLSTSAESPGVRCASADATSCEGLLHGVTGHEAVTLLTAISSMGKVEHLLIVNVLGTWSAVQTERASGIRYSNMFSNSCAAALLRMACGALSSPDCPPTDVRSVSTQVTDWAGQTFSRSGYIRVIVLRSTSTYASGLEADMSNARVREDAKRRHCVEGSDIAEAVRLAPDCEGPAYGCLFLRVQGSFASEKSHPIVERSCGENRSRDNRTAVVVILTPPSSISDERRCA